MIYSCTFYQLSGHTYDSLGCITGDTFESTTITAPCYLTETVYKERVDGKQVNVNGFILYVNYLSTMATIDKSWKVEIDSKKYSIVNIDKTFDDRHLEIILTDVTND